ncbi:hypothetical protein L6164_002024 [Bauhinia variegata]|uniref:Uncharacterized protein n=1 Tax=Bauhinia variegata TaxID=167791 RepID=A0ACB9PWX3_BAUVA|nr:hypothetical protein L6164_002024 [Bauhinia variegata]
MYRYLSSIRHVRPSSAASSLISLLASKPSARCYAEGRFPGLSLNQERFRGVTEESSRSRDGSGEFSSPRSFAFQNYMNRTGQRDSRTRDDSRPMDFVRGILQQDGISPLSRNRLEVDPDFVHIKILRNNTFVTLTDSKGNIKLKASAGCLKELRAGQKLSRYAAEATAEEVGRRCRPMGLKAVVMKVKGFTYFKKKRQAIMSWRAGFGSRGDRMPIVYVEDATRRPHNGCRQPKKRRI